MLTVLDGNMLAEAFPLEKRSSATVAGIDAAGRLAQWQRTERFAVQVEGETVLIPARLHFACEQSRLAVGTESWLLACALQTRSSDGFERQRAMRHLLVSVQPWAAPFIVELVGSYVVEILEDIYAGITPELARIIGAFLAENPAYWNTIKSRVTSYWDVYYRPRWRNGRAERSDDYVGFRLIQQLQAAASQCALAAH